jgi:hypothetical protein
MLDSEALEMIKSAGYTLIMDEVANVLHRAPIAASDIEMLLDSKRIEVKIDGSVVWIDENYGKTDENEIDLRFRDIKNLAQSENLFIFENSAIFWTMDINSFLSFKEVYVLTYLFDGQLQKYYYDIHSIEHEKFSVNKNISGYELIKYDKFKEPRKEIYDKLNIYENYKKGRTYSKLNSNFDDEAHKRGVLSSSWFEKTSEKNIKQLNNNLQNYFLYQTKTENKKLFWTTKKKFAPLLKNKKSTFNKKDDRNKDNFVSLFTRATNDYADCESMAYVYNRFVNPMEKKFFLSKGAKVDEEVLAMSDLIQFVFRGCIRKGEPMNCYIPADRMRQLLKDWSEFKD